MNLGLDSDRARYAAVVLAALVLAGGAYVYTQQGGTPTGAAVQEALELSTGSELEVLQTQDRGSIDRVVLSDGNNVINAWVSDDGRYLVQATRNGQVLQGFTPLRNLTRTLQARNEFISCLDRNNATFYGVVSQDQRFAQHTQAVQLQLQALGGQQATQLFGGTGPQQMQRLVLNINRTQGIVWQVGGNLRSGVHTIPMLEQQSTCEYTVETGTNPYR